MITRAMWSVVCDDVRSEVGGKLSYMGVYAGDIIVPSFPTTLPRLCFVLTVRTDSRQPFKQLSMRVEKDNGVLAQVDIPGDELEKMVARDASHDAPDHQRIVGAVCAIGPIVFDTECVLRMRATSELEELKGGTVRVRSIDEK